MKATQPDDARAADVLPFPARVTHDQAFAEAFDFERCASVVGVSHLGMRVLAPTVSERCKPVVADATASRGGFAVLFAVAVLGLALAKAALGRGVLALVDIILDAVIDFVLNPAVGWTFAIFGWSAFFGLLSAGIWR